MANRNRNNRGVLNRRRQVKKESQLAQIVGVFLLSVVMLVICHLAVTWEANLPRVYKSNSTGEIVKVEQNGKEISFEAVERDKYEIVWVE